MATVLVVDDDAGIRESAVLALRKAGHRLLEAGDAASAMRLLREHRVDVVVSDIYMPGDDGLTLLKAISERRDPPRVILMTARGSIETTALAKRFGAFDYLAKPFDLAELIDRVAAAARKSGPRTAEIKPPPDSRIIGTHPSMIEMYKAIARVASLSVPVLILGESGSGKELVARAIHDLGAARAPARSSPINCGAIPDTLLESRALRPHARRLHRRARDRAAACSSADGGTLFLDEIGEISPALQVKLLRVLQDGDGHARSVGEEPPGRRARHRRDPPRPRGSASRAGAFREDLYYRLAGYEIAIPPLRDRRDDIPMLVEHFRRKVAGEMASSKAPSSAFGTFSPHAGEKDVQTRPFSPATRGRRCRRRMRGTSPAPPKPSSTSSPPNRGPATSASSNRSSAARSSTRER